MQYEVQTQDLATAGDVVNIAESSGEPYRHADGDYVVEVDLSQQQFNQVSDLGGVVQIDVLERVDDRYKEPDSDFRNSGAGALALVVGVGLAIAAARKQKKQ